MHVPCVLAPTSKHLVSRHFSYKKMIRTCIHKNLYNSQSVRQYSYAATVQGIWKTISDSTPVAYMQEGLTFAHDITGLPWWASIVVSTVVLRSIVTLPLTVYQFKIMGRLEKITKEMPAIIEELKRETAYGVKKYNWTEKQAKSIFAVTAREQWNKLVVRENCHPAKTAITVWVQIPLWVIQSVAIRNMVYCLPDPGSLQAQLTFTELTVGGFGWIPNLIEIDSSWILPVTLGAVNLMVIQIQTAIRKGGPGGKLHNYATNAFRGLSILMIPIATMVPSCLCLYWVASSTYGLVQNVVLISPKVRTLLGIPQLSHLPKDKPYKFLIDRLLNRKKD